MTTESGGLIAPTICQIGGNFLKVALVGGREAKKHRYFWLRGSLGNLGMSSELANLSGECMFSI